MEISFDDKSLMSTVDRSISFLECIVVLPLLHFTLGYSRLPCSSSIFRYSTLVYSVVLYSAVGNCTPLCCTLRYATLHCSVCFVFLLCCFSLRVCRALSVFPGTSISRSVCLHVFDYIFISLVCLSLYVSGPPTVRPCRVSATCR